MESEVKEKKRKGRKKGAVVTKEPETVIEDSLIAPYKIYIDPRCFSVAENNPSGGFEKQYGHYTSLGDALKKVARMKTISSAPKQTIDEFIERFDNSLKTFSEKFKI